jgi:hypothetical protein
METPLNKRPIVKCAYVIGWGYFVNINGFTSCGGVAQHTARNELLFPGYLTRAKAERMLKEARMNPYPAGEFPKFDDPTAL